MAVVDEVEVQRYESVAVVRLVAPQRRNALTSPMATELSTRLRSIGRDTQVGAIVVSSVGNGFCAGADISVMQGALEVPKRDDDVRSLYDVVNAVREIPVPVVAAIEGAAVGAGLNLALACDLRVAGATARFESRFLRIGLHPGGGHSALLTNAVGAQMATAIILFGQQLDARMALKAGLVAEVVEAGEAESVAIERATAVASLSRSLVVATKATLSAAASLAFNDVLELEAARQLDLLELPELREPLETLIHTHAGTPRRQPYER